MKRIKGLLVSVLYNAHYRACAAGGVTEWAEKAILTGDSIPEIFEPSKDTPALKLVTRDIGGKYLHAEPVDPVKPGNVGYMFGGNFIYSSDSRFPSRYPIPVHDRQETQSTYDVLSR